MKKFKENLLDLVSLEESNPEEPIKGFVSFLEDGTKHTEFLDGTQMFETTRSRVVLKQHIYDKESFVAVNKNRNTRKIDFYSVEVKDYRVTIEWLKNPSLEQRESCSAIMGVDSGSSGEESVESFYFEFTDGTFIESTIRSFYEGDDLVGEDEFFLYEEVRRGE